KLLAQRTRLPPGFVAVVEVAHDRVERPEDCCWSGPLARPRQNLPGFGRGSALQRLNRSGIIVDVAPCPGDGDCLRIMTQPPATVNDAVGDGLKAAAQKAQ